MTTERGREPELGHSIHAVISLQRQAEAAARRCWWGGCCCCTHSQDFFIFGRVLLSTSGVQHGKVFTLVSCSDRHGPCASVTTTSTQNAFPNQQNIFSTSYWFLVGSWGIRFHLIPGGGSFQTLTDGISAHWGLSKGGWTNRESAWICCDCFCLCQRNSLC